MNSSSVDMTTHSVRVFEREARNIFSHFASNTCTYTTRYLTIVVSLTRKKSLECYRNTQLRLPRTQVLPIAFIVISMCAELDATKHFVEDLTIKLRQLKYGIFGERSKSDVILDHFRLLLSKMEQTCAKYPKLSVAICRPLQQMNTVIAKLVFSEERLNC